jgi:lipopolysaccharide/colanic/teichoic acid biosynthesis glycosyltransferase
MTRVFDIFASLILGLVSIPFLLIAAVGIWISSPGPILFKSKRVGKDLQEFTMYKFRTMRINSGGANITGGKDPRIFSFGQLLRKTKVDELPQLLNILRGEMSFVGPRPEAPSIVYDHYTNWMKDTLSVLPGLTSPGSIYYYTACEENISDDDPEGYYINHVLPEKLAIDLHYFDTNSFLTDLRVIFDTAWMVVNRFFGQNPKYKSGIVQSAKSWLAKTKI